MDLDKLRPETLAALERASRQLAEAGYVGPEHLDPRPAARRALSYTPLPGAST